MDQVEAGDVVQVGLFQVYGVLLEDAAPVAAHKDPVPLHQGDPGEAVLPGVAAAVGAADPLFVQRALDVAGHGVPTENTHKIRLCPQLAGVNREVHRLAAGIHGPGVQIDVADVVTQAQNLYHCVAPPEKWPPTRRWLRLLAAPKPDWRLLNNC